MCLAPPPPARKRRLMAPCWYSQLLYSNLLAAQIFIETPGVDNNPGYYFFIACFSAVVFPSPLPLFLTAKVV